MRPDLKALRALCDAPIAEPKKGFEYVEIKTPRKGVTISGAMDTGSLGLIVDLAIKAECDRDYVQPEQIDPQTVRVLIDEVERLRDAIREHSECSYECEKCGHSEPCATDDVVLAVKGTGHE